MIDCVNIRLLMPNTHRRCDSTAELSRVAVVYTIRNYLATVSTSLNKFANIEVELRRVGGVNAPVGSRDAVYNNPCAVGEKWRHNDVIVEKVINVEQNSRSSVSK